MSKLKLFSKPRTRRASPEACLQMTVVEYLRLVGVPGLLFFSVPNEQKCSVQRGAQLKRMGRLSGVSDLVILIPGRGTLFLELKAKGEKQTENQEAFENAVCEWFPRHWYFVADTIDKAISILTEYGAIKNVSRRRAASPFSEAA